MSRFVNYRAVEVTPHPELLRPNRTFGNVDAVALSPLHLERSKIVRTALHCHLEVIPISAPALLVVCHHAPTQQILQDISHQSFTPGRRRCRKGTSNALYRRSKNQPSLVVVRLDPVLLQHIRMQSVQIAQEVNRWPHLLRHPLFMLARKNHPDIPSPTICRRLTSWPRHPTFACRFAPRVPLSSALLSQVLARQ